MRFPWCWLKHRWVFGNYMRDFGTNHMVTGYRCARCGAKKIKLDDRAVFSDKDFEWLHDRVPVKDSEGGRW